MYQYNLKNKDYARENRNNPTHSEKSMWQILRKRQVLGMKFIRQFAMSHFIFDFYCVEKRLAIEVDGSIHHKEQVKSRDEEKNSYCRRHSITLIRFTDEEITGGNIESIVARIESALTNTP